MSDIAIKISNVSKAFKLPHEKYNSVKSLFINIFRHKRSYEIQQALKDVSFEVKKGEFFGIVGRNGSGKSTLLKMIAGIYSPTYGEVKINGSLTPFIELGVGFNPELTGRENVFLNGALLGFSRKDMQSMYKDIVEFAELEKFMDQKLKNYSSGMQVRLAFSIAIRARSDILLLDEVLAVGDALFQQKCYNYFHQLKKSGKTVLFVSHDTNALSRYCTNGVLIEGGKLVTLGPIDKVLSEYTSIISRKESSERDRYSRGGQPHQGTGKAHIKEIELLGGGQKKKAVFTDDDKEIIIKVQFNAKDDIESPVYGITIKDPSGLKVFSSNNLWLSLKSKDLNKGDTQYVIWRIPNYFNTGEYTITPAAADTYGSETYDQVEDMGSFKIRKKRTTSGLINAPHEVKFG